MRLFFIAEKAEFCPTRNIVSVRSARGKLIFKLLENPEQTLITIGCRKRHAPECDPENDPKHIHYVGALFFEREFLRFVLVRPDDPRLKHHDPEVEKILMKVEGWAR
jgi:hypothetical protein